jgi:hypothetical protein
MNLPVSILAGRAVLPIPGTRRLHLLKFPLGSAEGKELIFVDLRTCAMGELWSHQEILGL